MRKHHFREVYQGSVPLGKLPLGLFAEKCTIPLYIQHSWGESAVQGKCGRTENSCTPTQIKQDSFGECMSSASHFLCHFLWDLDLKDASTATTLLIPRTSMSNTCTYIYIPGPSNYQKNLVVLVLWSFWSFCLFCVILRMCVVICCFFAFVLC